MAAETITTSKIALPREVAASIVGKSRDSSVIQTLSPSTPMLFKDISHVLFTKEPEAEFVGEGAQKGAAAADLAPVPGTIHKAQVTVRLSDEVRWADEDSQIGIIDAITQASAAAVGRALDYGIIHAINPATGAAAPGMTALTDGAVAVNATADPSADVDALVAAVSEDYDVSGLALSKAFANDLRKLRAKGTGARVYPEIPLNLQPGTLDGIAAATSGTVSGRLAKKATNVLALLGDFSMIKWGIVRDLGLEVIETGDPDGLGDLKRLNQVAYRTEVVYSWAVLDPKAFAVLKRVAG
ncbi:phage major capsid protein [Eggerthellaceae bacterium zg-997]|nr:phage major capsid protein [Eggerthellaceae bacterium zg-997]